MTIIDGEKHEENKNDCSSCWGNYPRKCKCGGLVHAGYIDEDWDNVFLGYSCDKCGEDYEELDD